MRDMPAIRTPALILRKFEFGETSQVLHLLTRDRGRVHVLAKGSLKPKSSFLGPLDVLEMGEARLYPKRDALSILGGFERGTAFPGVRRSLPRLEAAFGILEVLSEASREEHADPGLFDLGVESLLDLETTPGERAPLALLRFDLRALAALGVGPVLDACVACGTKMAAEKSPVLSPARGGALCSACRGQDVLALHATRGVLAALSRLAAADGAASARLALGPRDLRLARRLVDALLGNAVEKEIRGARR
jgi:DNA repair protein RecO (recombination protein O)